MSSLYTYSGVLIKKLEGASGPEGILGDEEEGDEEEGGDDGDDAFDVHDVSPMLESIGGGRVGADSR